MDWTRPSASTYWQAIIVEYLACLVKRVAVVSCTHHSFAYSVLRLMLRLLRFILIRRERVTLCVRTSQRVRLIDLTVTLAIILSWLWYLHHFPWVVAAVKLQPRMLLVRQKYLAYYYYCFYQHQSILSPHESSLINVVIIYIDMYEYLPVY
jgi:hypothetical protein